jgi:hypothetical protein
MVYTAVGTQPLFRPRFGSSGGLPLAHRFEQARTAALAYLKQSDPEFTQVANAMVSEPNLDMIEDAVEAVRQRREPPVSEELRRARREVYDLVVTHDRLVGELKTAQQRWLWRAKSDWRHKLLKSLKADMTTLPPLMIPNWDADTYQDPQAARLAAREVFAKVQYVENLVSLISNGMQFDGLDDGAQAIHLIHALWDDRAEDKTRLIAVEAQLSAALAEIEKLRRSTKSKKD